MTEPRDPYGDTIEAHEIEGMGWAWVVHHGDGSPGQACAGFESEDAALAAGREANAGDHLEPPALTSEDLLEIR